MWRNTLLENLKHVTNNEVGDIFIENDVEFI